MDRTRAKAGAPHLPVHWLLAALLAGSPIAASDGVIEINQARAIAGGVTVGDLPGFPVTLSQSGSYRLTGGLDVTGEPSPEHVTAIEITSSFVTLDLNGFELLGPTLCTGSPVDTCAPEGAGRGIASAGANFVVIRNGTVRGFGGVGIHAGHATIDGVSAVSNGGTGLWIQFGGIVKRSSSRVNGHDGIAGDGLLVRATHVAGNRLSGIYVNPGIVGGAVSWLNGWFGIHAVDGLIVESTARENLQCAIGAPGGAFARNVAIGTATICGGVSFEPNLCSGPVVCP